MLFAEYILSLSDYTGENPILSTTLSKPTLLELTSKGLYCPLGKFYIDPVRAVDRALITHAHGDHVKAGMKSYMTHKDSIPIMKLRINEDISCEGLKYGEERNINGVKVSFHPAGHIIGSSQIRLEHKGEVWVVSGDYKTEDDGFTVPYQPIKCHTFITESTFGLPLFKWKAQEDIFGEINNWWKANKLEGKASIILAYSLGKAQRILHLLDKSIGPIYVHSSIYEINKVMRENGIAFPDFPMVDTKVKKDIYRDSIIIAPPGWASNNWLRRFQPYSTAVTSGWVALRGMRNGQSADKGFVLSDHSDWEGLNYAVKACEAERVYVTHGYTKVFAKWLQNNGLDAHVLSSLSESSMPEDLEGSHL